jgi:hypothetical protein
MESKEVILEGIKNINERIDIEKKRLEYYTAKLIELESKPKWSLNYDCLVCNSAIVKSETFHLFSEFSFETEEQRNWFYDKHIDLLKVYYGATKLPKP